MEKGDLIKCWSMNQYNEVGIVLEHDKELKKVFIHFQTSGETKSLYSRDVQLFKRCPTNARKLKEKLDNH